MKYLCSSVKPCAKVHIFLFIHQAMLQGDWWTWKRLCSSVKPCAKLNDEHGHFSVHQSKHVLSWLMNMETNLFISQTIFLVNSWTLKYLCSSVKACAKVHIFLFIHQSMLQGDWWTWSSVKACAKLNDEHGHFSVHQSKHVLSWLMNMEYLCSSVMACA